MTDSAFDAAILEAERQYAAETPKYDVSDMCDDNAVTFFRNGKIASVTFSQPKFINKIRALAEQNPDEVKIFADQDGVITANIPVSYLHIYKSYSREMSDEEKEVLIQRLKQIREEKFSKKEN